MNDIDKIQVASSDMFADLLRQIFSAVGLLVITFGTDWRLLALSQPGAIPVRAASYSPARQADPAHQSPDTGCGGRSESGPAGGHCGSSGSESFRRGEIREQTLPGGGRLAVTREPALCADPVDSVAVHRTDGRGPPSLDCFGLAARKSSTMYSKRKSSSAFWRRCCFFTNR